jgi:hypothetical protein
MLYPVAKFAVGAARDVPAAFVVASRCGLLVVILRRCDPRDGNARQAAVPADARAELDRPSIANKKRTILAA